MPCNAFKHTKRHRCICTDNSVALLLLHQPVKQLLLSISNDDSPVLACTGTICQALHLTGIHGWQIFHSIMAMTQLQGIPSSMRMSLPESPAAMQWHKGMLNSALMYSNASCLPALMATQSTYLKSPTPLTIMRTCCSRDWWLQAYRQHVQVMHMICHEDCCRRFWLSLQTLQLFV